MQLCEFSFSACITPAFAQVNFPNALAKDRHRSRNRTKYTSQLHKHRGKNIYVAKGHNPNPLILCFCYIIGCLWRGIKYFRTPEHFILHIESRKNSTGTIKFWLGWRMNVHIWRCHRTEIIGHQIWTYEQTTTMYTNDTGIKGRENSLQYAQNIFKKWKEERFNFF